MKNALPIFAMLTLAFFASQAAAQSQQDQQSCEGDVYNLCGDKIPDQDEIVACLRKKWSKVSKECRHVMASYGKKHGKKRRHEGRSAVESRQNAND